MDLLLEEQSLKARMMTSLMENYRLAAAVAEEYRNPVAFLVVGNNQVRLLPVDNGAIYDRLLDMVPKVIEQIRGGGPNPGQNISPQSMYEI